MSLPVIPLILSGSYSAWAFARRSSASALEKKLNDSHAKGRVRPARVRLTEGRLDE
jgi:hypothetical protein